jgi:hypothetical protein
MLNYNELKDKGREFLAATGLKRDEFEKLLPVFQSAYEKKYLRDRTQEGKARQRRADGGAKGRLPSFEDKLLFILVYQKTHPLQTMHGLHLTTYQFLMGVWKAGKGRLFCRHLIRRRSPRLNQDIKLRWSFLKLQWLGSVYALTFFQGVSGDARHRPARRARTNTWPTP